LNLTIYVILIINIFRNRV